MMDELLEVQEIYMRDRTSAERDIDPAENSGRNVYIESYS